MRVLTARQIKEIDEVTLDENALNTTLNVALTFHANRMHEVTKRKDAWWEEQAEIHGFDLNVPGGYQVLNGRIQLKKLDEKE